MFEKEGSKNEVEAGKKVETLIEDFKKLELDPDMAAFLLMTSGMVLMLNNNKNDSAYVTYMLSSALIHASTHVGAQTIEENEGTKH
jgi:hypothetical protein